jgi:hypothetical protein
MRSLSSAFAATRHRAAVVVAGCAATAALALAGCSAAPASHHSGGQNQTGGAQGQAGGQGQATADKAVALAAKSAAKLTSLTVVETMTVHGIPMPAGGLAPGAGAGAGTNAGRSLTMHLNASMRLKPTILAAIAMHMNFGGRSIVLNEIITSRAMYLKFPGILPTRAGKPWAKISLASLPNHASLQKLFAQTQQSNPLTAMGNPAGLAKFLAAAKHVRIVRNQSVDGVAATEYSGVIDLRALAPSMPASAHQMLGSLGPAAVQFWIDRQHQMRKMDMRLAFGKVSIVMAAHVTSINQPVQIVPPPPSEVSSISHP